MKAKAIYHQDVNDDGISSYVTHTVDVDGGGFVVSSEKVGVAIQNLLNNAKPQDLVVLHAHLLKAYASEYHEMMLLPVEGEEPVRHLGPDAN